MIGFKYCSKDEILMLLSIQESIARQDIFPQGELTTIILLNAYNIKPTADDLSQYP